MPTTFTSLIIPIIKGGFVIFAIGAFVTVVYFGLIKPIMKKLKKEKVSEVKEQPPTEDPKVKWVREVIDKGYDRKQMRILLKRNGYNREYRDKMAEMYDLLKQREEAEKLPEL